MAKIEVLTELLVEELSEFKQDLKKFEELSGKLDGMELKPNLSELQLIQDSFLDEQKVFFQNQVKQFSSFKKLHSLKNTYPKWLIGLLASVLIIFLSFTTYAFYSIKRSNQQVELLKTEKEQVIHHFSSFIKSEPLISKNYSKWKNKK